MLKFHLKSPQFTDENFQNKNSWDMEAELEDIRSVAFLTLASSNSFSLRLVAKFQCDDIFRFSWTRKR